MNYTPQLRTTDAETTGVHAYDNWLRYQAQSVLVGLVDNPEPPTIEQARDVLAWAALSRGK